MHATTRKIAAALIVAAFGYAGAAIWIDDGPPQDAGFRDTGQREPADCGALAGPGTAVLFTLGQSNAANHGATPHSPSAAVFNFNPFDGRCYRARDPLLGATGTEGSVWSRLATRLVEAGAYERVVIIAIAVEATSVVAWAEGEGRPRIAWAARRARDAGLLPPTHVLWHQGESDAIAGMGAARHHRQLTGVVAAIRGAGIQAPIYVAQASLCGAGSRSEAIRSAQRAVAAGTPGVLPGPDTDTLAGPALRHDGCHFTGAGLDAHAGLWFSAIKQNAPFAGLPAHPISWRGHQQAPSGHGNTAASPAAAPLLRHHGRAVPVSRRPLRAEAGGGAGWRRRRRLLRGTLAGGFPAQP
ncbi:MAG: hypothetical protein EXQ87_05965 [Alphaproteobacteria bacterium]|nr:hypothetical protein [Alphaproteobacteria bacterium]